MDSENLAYGRIVQKYKMRGKSELLTEFGLTNKEGNFFMIFLNIKPNTTYTFFTQDNIKLEDRYYWLKLAEFPFSSEELQTKLLVPNTNINVDPSGNPPKAYSFAEGTGTPPKVVTYTTSNIAKSLVIQVSKNIEPSYIEIREGIFSQRKYNSYEEGIINNFFPRNLLAKYCGFFTKNTEANLYDKSLDIPGYRLSTETANKITGNQPSYTLRIVKIKPNTVYSVLVSDTNNINVGNYSKKYIKVATITELPSNPLNIVFGSIGKTIYDTLKTTFTSGNNDNYLIIDACSNGWYSDNKPEIQVVEGIQDEITIDGDDFLYSPEGIFVYPKNKVYNKTEVNNLLKNYDRTNNILFEKTSEGIYITQAKSQYFVSRRITESINLDTWLIRNGKINDVTIWSDTDIEGPIKQVDTADFIGGIHGDEKYKSVTILVDGKKITESEIVGKSRVSNITIFVVSDVYFCNDTENIAFERHKKLEFINRKLVISNTWKYIGTSEFKVERYTGCGLYSVYKSLLVGYSTNIDSELVTNRATSGSKLLDTVYFYGNNFVIRIHTLSGKTETYSGSVADFSSESKPRFKAYLDCARSPFAMNTNDIISASFEIEIV